ncbi:histidine utilization repressor [Rhizobium ruizarguesonis]
MTKAVKPAAGEARHYIRIKEQILAEIAEGKLQPGDRVSSESELVAAFGVSRMTANRALRELMFEGVLKRSAGIGTFVSPKHLDVDLLQIRNIADEILERGHTHQAIVVKAGLMKADANVADALELILGAEVMHSLIVHMENDRPIQVEERYVNPLVAPDYLSADFRSMTPHEYLTEVAPITAFEHIVQAVKPDPAIRKYLGLRKDHPCLRVFRRTWSGEAVVTCALLYYPGAQYRLEARSTKGPARPVAILGEKQ